MVSWDEKFSRWKSYFSFNLNELSGLITAAVVTGFIFSFRDWGGDTFNFFLGLQHLILAILAAGIIFFVRSSLQKTYGLAEGYKVEFKPFWGGIIIALIVAFITNGLIPLVIIGGTSVIFITKQRMGEYRYAFSYWNNGIISLWVIYSAVIIAIIFGLGLHFFPENYFFGKGVLISVLMGFFALLPIPQMDAYSIYFAATWLYLVALGIMIFAALLIYLSILTKSLIGLIILIIFGAIAGFIYYMIGSEK
ncbi:hypothetical protein HYT52_02800 [Candidatus Woesearchaeota archaeon]|nr:hypothetical protein [Candidatus Woesearchaeota archaeon]